MFGGFSFSKPEPAPAPAAPAPAAASSSGFSTPPDPWRSTVRYMCCTNMSFLVHAIARQADGQCSVLIWQQHLVRQQLSGAQPRLLSSVVALLCHVSLDTAAIAMHNAVFAFATWTAQQHTPSTGSSTCRYSLCHAVHVMCCCLLARWRRTVRRSWHHSLVLRVASCARKAGSSSQSSHNSRCTHAASS
jgi:hypothetical protein